MTTTSRILTDGRKLEIESANRSVKEWRVSIDGNCVGEVNGVYAFNESQMPVRDGVRFTHFVKFAHDSSFCLPITSSEWSQLEPQWEAGGIVDEGARKTRPADAMRAGARRESLMEFNDENVECG